MHLTPDELVDVAEGTRRESSAPHFATCEMCRRQVADLRAMMTMAASVEVPEPSPLFWNHFSSRVRDAIAATPERSGWRWIWTRVRLPIAIAVAPAILVLSLLAVRVIAPAPAPMSLPLVFVAAPPPPPEPPDASAADDASFTLLTNLSGDIDVDTAHEAGLTAAGSAEHAVTQMTNDELRELRRLLQEELANSGD
jgi:hypothetical protein